MIGLICVFLFRLFLFCLLRYQLIPGWEDIGVETLVTTSTSWPDRDGVVSCSLNGVLADAALSLVKVTVHLLLIL